VLKISDILLSEAKEIGFICLLENLFGCLGGGKVKNWMHSWNSLTQRFWFSLLRVTYISTE
jgi:hypothetical protein